MCQVKALAMSKQNGIQDFKANKGQEVRILVRNNLCVRKRYKTGKQEEKVPGK
jgi:hypothetical protein